LKSIKIEVPYDSVLSKNRMYVFTRKSQYRKIPNSQHEKAKDYITTLFRSKLSNNPHPQKSKTYIDVVAFKPNMRGDASNLIDGICDAIKKCFNFDDNYFSGSWDWFIDKKNPRIEITVKYEDELF